MFERLYLHSKKIPIKQAMLSVWFLSANKVLSPFFIFCKKLASPNLNPCNKKKASPNQNPGSKQKKASPNLKVLFCGCRSFTAK
jgi:hypothetical protein